MVPSVPTQSTQAALVPLHHVFLSPSTQQFDLKNHIYMGVGSFESHVSLSRSCVYERPNPVLQRAPLSLRFVFERADGKALLDKTLVLVFLQNDGLSNVLLLSLDGEQQLRTMVPGPHCNPRWDLDWSPHS